MLKGDTDQTNKSHVHFHNRDSNLRSQSVFIQKQTGRRAVHLVSHWTTSYTLPWLVFCCVHHNFALQLQEEQTARQRSNISSSHMNVRKPCFSSLSGAHHVKQTIWVPQTSLPSPHLSELESGNDIKISTWGCVRRMVPVERHKETQLACISKREAQRQKHKLVNSKLCTL